MRPFPRRAIALLAVVALALAACSDGDTEAQEPDEPEAASTELRISAASFDLHVGEDQRLLAGIMTMDQGLVAFGEVDIEIGPVGDDPEQVELTQAATARFLPVPGDEQEGEGTRPSVLVGASGAGVYEAFVDLDEPGPWAMRVVAEMADGTTRQGTAAFQVGEEPQVPAVGDEAPRTQNLTVDDVGGDVLPVMVDSRAQDELDDVPDAHIHDTTIADAIEDGRPVVALFATPVYCMSRFCGPITEVFADLAEQYADQADFVHVEVWRDFDAQELNDAAAEWIQTEQGGNEPWAFLIDEEGRVAARWDNVLDADALVDELERLPAMTHTEGDDGE
jgi:hypothetical protein